jgi:competence protein ComEC
MKIKRISLLAIVILLILLASCGENRPTGEDNSNHEPPEIIGVISVPDTVYTRSFFVASIVVNDPQDLDVQVRFNWGNGVVSEYTSFSSSGSSLEMAYAYQNSGIYTISVTARNSAGLTISDESSTRQITVLDKEHPGPINDLLIHNNRLFMTTSTDVNLTLSYERESMAGRAYKGYSAQNKRNYVDFPLPVESSNIDYQLYLELQNDVTIFDTLLVFTSTDSQYPLLRVDFVDVKQGDGALIQTPEGEVIAVDGGYGTRVPPFANPDATWHGAGYPYMLDYVLSENIGRFRFLVETHRHQDHWGGLQDIIDHNIPYDYYLSPDEPIDYEVGDFLNINSTVSFEILNIDFPPGVSQSSENNRSIVLKVEYGEIAYLLTGDMEHPVENYLVNNNFSLSADVLKIGHHGSQTSSRDYFLNEVLNRHARIGVISFGTGNPYNHPHDLQRFADYEIFGTNQPSEQYHGDNYHFDTGDVKTYSDGYIIIVSYEK